MARIVGAGAPPALPYLVTRVLLHLLVGGVLPPHKILDDTKQTLTLDVGDAVLQCRLRTRLRHIREACFVLCLALPPQVVTLLELPLCRPPCLRHAEERVHIG